MYIGHWPYCSPGNRDVSQQAEEIEREKGELGERPSPIIHKSYHYNIHYIMFSGHGWIFGYSSLFCWEGGEFSLFLPIFFKVFSLLQFSTYKVGKIKKRGILCNDNVLVAIMRKTLLHRQPMLRGKGCEGQCSDVRVTADVIFLECNRAWQQGCKIIIKHFMVKGYSEVCAFL